MVGIPLQAALNLTVLENDAIALPGRYDLCPVPQPHAEVDLTGRVVYNGQESVRDPEAYAADATYPASPAKVVSTGMVRSQRVAQLSFYPFRYNPVSGTLYHSQRIRVRLDLTPGKSQALAARPTIAEGSFEGILQRALLNYDIARTWRAHPQAQIAQAAVAAPGSPAYKVLVDQDGIYQITRGDLEAIAPAVGDVDPRTFQLHSRGQEVALYVAGEEDGFFDPEDYILFYGQKTETKYTDTNVYWLTWGSAMGRRMATRDGNPGGTGVIPQAFWHTTHVEEDHIYASNIPSGEDQDHWFWNYVYANGSPALKDYVVPLDDIATVTFSPIIRGKVDSIESIPVVSPDHHVQIYLNGNLVDDASWDGKAEYAFEISVPQAYLIKGDNTITVRCPLDLGLSRDIIYANWFEIDYERAYTAVNDELAFDNDSAGIWEYHLAGWSSGDVEVFDVTEPTRVGRIVSIVCAAGTCQFEDTIGARTQYVALTTARRLAPLDIVVDIPSDLRSTGNGADYVIITHGDFYTEVLPLESYRASQGLRTMVADVQDVYDEFSYAVFDPRAIHDFLAYAYANWAPPAPAYVLLVGDGSLDFKDNMGTGYLNFVPPYLAAVDPWINETASDNRYVCVSGDDPFPDMHVGRLPANSPAEVSAMVDKILDYEQNPPSGDWNQQVLFVADNEDQDGDFAGFSDAVADRHFPVPYSAQKVYLGVTHASTGEARAAIIGAINEGRLLVNYVGHASYQWWATEQILRVSDIASLANGPKLPVMVPMTCYEGFFHAPGIPSLGESLVRVAGKGAIASWSPTGLGVAMGHDDLNNGLYDAIFESDVTQLGPATTEAKLYLYSNSSTFLELLDTYVLFGDPALRLDVLDAEVGIEKSVEPTALVLPTDPVTYTLTVTNQGPATAHGLVITDLLPAFIASPQVVSTSLGLAQRPGEPFAWEVADLAAGEGGRIVIRGAVDGAAGTGWFENRAEVATTSQETGSLPNEASVSVQVVAGPPFQVEANAAPAEIPAGGHQSTIRAQVTDLWDNAVADGTTVHFETSLGSIAPASTSTAAGLATAVLTSGQVSGTATVTVTAGSAQDTVQVVFGAKAPHYLWLPVIRKGTTP